MHPRNPFGKADIVGVIKVSDMANILKVRYLPQVFENVGPFEIGVPREAQGVADICQPNYFFVNAGLYF